MSKAAIQPASKAALTELLRSGVWTVDQVSLLLDTPASIVERWCRLKLIAGVKHVRGAWAIPGPGLFFFCARRLEPHYSPRSAAAVMDKSYETVRDWIKARRISVLKLGTAKSATVLIPESELLKFLRPS